MTIYISTNIYTRSEDLPKILELMPLLPKDCGIELFPLNGKEGYPQILENLEASLSAIPLTFHGPYYGCEPSAPKGTPAYDQMKALYLETFQWSKRLGITKVVHHFNNCNLTKPVSAMRQQALDNYRELQELADGYGVTLLVENVGIGHRGDLLYDQAEFTESALKNNWPILIDIGHAHCNQWHFDTLLEDLKDLIDSYHLHNNDGIADSHNRILDGTLDFQHFVQLYQTHTPGRDVIFEYTANYSGPFQDFVDDVNTFKTLLKK